MTLGWHILIEYQMLRTLATSQLDRLPLESCQPTSMMRQDSLGPLECRDALGYEGARCRRNTCSSNGSTPTISSIDRKARARKVCTRSDGVWIVGTVKPPQPCKHLVLQIPRGPHIAQIRQVLARLFAGRALRHVAGSALP